MPVLMPFTFDFCLNRLLDCNNLSICFGNAIAWTCLCAYITAGGKYFSGKYANGSIGELKHPMMEVRTNPSAVAEESYQGEEHPQAPAARQSVPLISTIVIVNNEIIPETKGGTIPIYAADSVDDKFNVTKSFYTLCRLCWSHNHAINCLHTTKPYQNQRGSTAPHQVTQRHQRQL